MRALTCLGVGLTVLSSSAFAGPIPKASYSLNLQTEAYSVPMRDFTFPSGMRVIFQADHNQPIVAVTTVFDRGSEADPVGLEGIAHVCEHMAFKAKHGDLPKNWDVLAELGAVINASTSRDWTDYLTVAPKDSLIPLLQIEALRMLDGVERVSAEELEKEREVVRNELRMRYENAALGAAWEDIAEMLYPKGHPYNRTTIGTHESLDAITIDDVRNFVKTNYTPANATIVVVGDFDLEKTGEIIQEAFGSFPELLVDPAHPKDDLTLIDPKPRVDCNNVQDPPVLADKGPRHIKGPVDVETVVLAWSLPGGYCGNEPVMQVAAGNLTNYIYRTLVPSWEFDKLEGSLEGIGCFPDTNEYASSMVCFIEPTEGIKGERLAEKAADALYLQWDREARSNEYLRPLIEWSYNRNRNINMASLLQDLDNVGTLFGRSNQVAHYVHFTGSPMYYNDSFQAFSAVDPMKVEDIARKYITRDRMATIIVEPMDENERARREAAARAGGDSDKKQWEGVTDDLRYSTVFDAAELTPENIARVVTVPDPARLKVFTLDNGMRVTLLPFGQAPLVRAEVLLHGGALTETYGLDSLAEAMHSRGNKLQVTENLLAVAGFYGETSVANARRLQADGASGNLAAVLHKLRNEVEGFDWNLADKSQQLKSWRNTTRSDSKEPDVWAGRLLNARLYPGTNLASWRDPAWYEQAAAWPTDQLKTWIDRKYQPANAELIVVGKMNLEEAEKQVREYFSSWTAAAGAGAPISGALPMPSSLPDQQILVFDKPLATQSDVTLSCRLPRIDPQNDAARRVLAASLSERAWRKLREEAGVTYGAGVYSQVNPGGVGRLMMNSLVQNDAVGFAVKTMMDLAKAGAAGDVSDEEAARHKWSIGREVVISQASTGQMLGFLTGIRESGYDWDVFNSYAERLGAVKAADLPGLMSDCIGHEVVTIVGPKEYAESELQKAGLTYEVVDWNALYESTLTAKELKDKKKKDAKDALEKAKEATPAPAGVASN